MTWIDEMKAHMDEQVGNGALELRMDALEARFAELIERVNDLAEDLQASMVAGVDAGLDAESNR